MLTATSSLASEHSISFAGLLKSGSVGVAECTLRELEITLEN
jgi:hypothetical protein